MTDENERVLALEEKIAHLHMTNEELSSEVHEQWKKINLLEKKLNHLENALNSYEHQLSGPPENTKPPHW